MADDLEWKTVPKSSNIAAVAHCGEALHVRFKNGGVYRYPGCDAAHLEKLLTAESAGRYFGTHVKPHHKHERAERE